MSSKGKKMTGIPAKTIIAPCTCENIGQDLLYGKGMRIFNESGGKQSGFRCTVCKKIQQISIKR